MIRERAAGVDKDVIDVYRVELVEVLLEYIVDISLEGSWYTRQAERDD